MKIYFLIIKSKFKKRCIIDTFNLNYYTIYHLIFKDTLLSNNFHDKFIPYDFTIQIMKDINFTIIIQITYCNNVINDILGLLAYRSKKHLINIPLQPVMFHYSNNSLNNNQFI